MPFATLGLPQAILKGVKAAGHIEPTPIQHRAIPVIMQGNDLIASAQTGTGKTAAYLLPILSRMLEGEFRQHAQPLTAQINGIPIILNPKEFSTGSLGWYSSSKIVITTESPGELITLDEMERRYVRQVLNAVGGNKTHAARILGIDRRSLYRRLEEPRHEQKAESHPAPAPRAPTAPPASNGHNAGSASGAGANHGHAGEAEHS